MGKFSISIVKGLSLERVVAEVNRIASALSRRTAGPLSTVKPESPKPNTLWFDKSAGKVYIYSSVEGWIFIGGKQ